MVREGSKMKARTVLNFEYKGDIKDIVERWAASHDYRFKEMDGQLRMYQRGTGFWTAPMRMAYKQNGNKVNIEAYVYAPLLIRIMGLFLLPKETHVESGGFAGSVPRKMARKDVNALLEKLGQPLLT